MTKCIPLFILLLFGLGTFAQDTADYSDKYRKWKRQYAENAIVQLKDGALLVRLKTRNTSIDLYRNNGQYWVADRMEQEQFEENTALMKAFINEFDFCKVYFFYNDDTDSLLAGTRKGIFLNGKLKRDTSIVLTEDFYMIAELGTVGEELRLIKGDTAKATTYYDPAVLERAVVVKDADLMQMMDPFPFYVHVVIDRRIDKHVRSLNARLQNYYESTVSKKP